MKKSILTADGPIAMPSLRSLGFQSFPTEVEMYAELRRRVTLKMIRQAHEAELAEPGEVRSGIVGTPEW